MFIITAPYPELYISIQLPDPEHGDSIGNPISISSKYTMTGDLYTHKKTTTNKKHIFSFVLNRGRADSLIEFIISYLGSKIKIEDHTGKNWVGYILTDPIPAEFNTGELVSIEFEFEGEEI